MDKMSYDVNANYLGYIAGNLREVSRNLDKALEYIDEIRKKEGVYPHTAEMRLAKMYGEIVDISSDVETLRSACRFKDDVLRAGKTKDDDGWF